MSAPPDEKTWFVSLNDKRYGPFTFEALTEAAAKGVIDGETSVWRLGWVKWHPARKVPGLIAAPAPVSDAIEDGSPAELAPAVEQPVEARQNRPATRAKTPASAAAPAVGPPPLTAPAAVSAAAPAIVRAPDPELRLVTPVVTPEVLPPSRGDVTELAAEIRPPRRSSRRTGLAVLAVLLLVGGAGWGALKVGLLNPERFLRPTRTVEPGVIAPGTAEPKVAAASPQDADAGTLPTATESANDRSVTTSGGLPISVAELPAVAALRQHDPAAYERFSQRFVAGYAPGSANDEALSLARVMLRKSLKRQLAASPGEDLIEITQVYLGYMQGLQASDPGSCVALSDEGKGAQLTNNLARTFPDLFARDLTVLTHAANQVGGGPPALTAQQARPFLENVFGRLRQQSVRLDLLSRDKLEPAEFPLYCNLVIAFYQAVLGLPQQDSVELLRYLYAAAAADQE